MGDISLTKDAGKFVRFLDKSFNEIYLDSFDIDKIPLKDGCYLNRAQLLELSRYIPKADSLINPANIKKISGEDWYFVNGMIRNILPSNEGEKNRMAGLEWISLERSGDDLFFIGTKGDKDSAGFVDYDSYKRGLYMVNLGKEGKILKGIGEIILKRTEKDKIEITLVDSEDRLIKNSYKFLFKELDFSGSFLKFD